MKISGIYKIISPTNKIYIGQSIDVYLRFKYSTLKSKLNPNHRIKNNTNFIYV